MDRRLQIGGRVPPPDPESDTVTLSRNKRSIFDIGVAEPSCPFTTEWVRLYAARDINNTEVVVFQPSDDNSNRFQWFYTVTCDYELLSFENIGTQCPKCCRAVNRRRYWSRCVPRKTYVMALIRRPTDHVFDWGYIQVDSSCNCAVTQRPF
ncbi:venom nerve growth factor-like [Mercenaria mercenaria]|uniref:venom nerve growth factor-like n=1 Tax=Mercenaria mercenaria TaxID=6596 RepID=UPI001E1D2DEC|nr:venom nerve growth factor-like [Mercenaria mercenaria]